ncbi:MAG: UvrD-helicase domain-containing protein [Lachnospiraceae bacterium]|nr:UvrD-helicase domain-containing protein [Lachnospiraceae bacterium]
MKAENPKKTGRQQSVGKWTEAQQLVIDTRDKNILVSAAAGSGKTAVLVERIISRILDSENPLDVDRILVVTFTNAAASEMRERILKAIEKELEKNPDNLHLQRQQAYIHNAAITTIHSFCLNLIREHFNDVDLDPGVKVAEPGEIELLKSDVIKEVLEEYYASGDKEFYQFVSQFEGKNNDY